MIGAAIVTILNVVLLALIPIAYIALAGWICWRHLWKLGYKTAATVMFLVVFSLPGLWMFAAWGLFKSECERNPPSVAVGTTFVEERGLLLKTPVQRVREHIHGLRSLGAIDYVEGEYQGQYVRQFERATERSDMPRSQISFVTTDLIAVSALLPVYRHNLQVQEVSSNRVLTEANEIVFGGGLTGMYMRFFKGQNYERLGCGYVDGSVRPWRPGYWPSNDHHIRADRRLISMAYGVKR